ncbi:hypothetical protein BSNK01_26650 [Bacillaceae bacterium]
MICPVCNGLASLGARCPHCKERMIDGGRLGDYYGDYSPYREIDDLKATNGYPDLRNGECWHLAFCPRCRRDIPWPVAETAGPAPTGP